MLSALASCHCGRDTDPEVDNGYDVEDYKEIAEQYGTVADVDELIVQLHKRGMKLILDLVVSPAHPAPSPLTSGQSHERQA